MIIAKTPAIVHRLSTITCLLVVFSHRPALAQCGGGSGMSCGGHSMSGQGMGHSSHPSGLSNGHSITGHTSGFSSSSNSANQLGGAARGNWTLPGGHSTHGGASGIGGNSLGSSSPPFGFRSSSPRTFSNLVKPTIHGRASPAYNTSLLGHALSHGNGTDTSAGWVSRSVDDYAPVALPRLQGTKSSSFLSPRLPSADFAGIRFDNHSAHQTHEGLTPSLSSGWAAKLQSRAQSDLSLPDSHWPRSQTRSDQTTLPTSRLRSLDSSHASRSRPNPSARFEGDVPPTNDWTLGAASGTRPVFRPSLDRYSAIELPATRGVEDFIARSHKVPTTQPTSGPSVQKVR